MTVCTIPDSDLLPPVVASADPAYDYEAQGRNSSRFRFGLRPAGLTLGVWTAGGERFRYLFAGFIPAQRTLVGSSAAFRQGGVTMTFKVVNGQVKERIRYASVAASVARLTIGIQTLNCHFEQSPLGGLVIWSDLTQKVIATVAPPTIEDANGRSDCDIHYELAVDGQSVDLVVDPAWLLTAAYPVTIDPTTIVTSVNTNSLTPTTANHIYKLSDAKLVALWMDAGVVKRSTSTDAGVTWSAASTIFSNGDTSGVMGFCMNGDTLYGVYSRLGTFDPVAFRMVYATGAFTDTSAALAGFGPGSSQPITALACQFDVTKGNWHAAISVEGTAGTTHSTYLIAINTSLAVISNTAAMTTTTAVQGSSLVVDTAGSPNVTLAITNGAAINLFPYVWNGTNYTGGTVETVGTEGGTLALAFDASGNIDLFWAYISALKTRKRTGVNTYSAVTTLVSSGVATSFGGRSLSVSRTGNGNADLFVLYTLTTFQASGEIYQIKRRAGSWQATTRVAGGTSAGWSVPTAIDLIQGDGKVHMLYLNGTDLVYDGSLVTGTAPSAPINVLPSGNANTSLTPTISCTYKNTDAADPLGSYEILVTRQSDSVVMWDTGKTTYSGSTIVDGGSFTKVYAGTGLAKAITYLLQVKFWDANGDLAGSYNTAVTFQVNDAPAVAITSSATPASSGPTIVWTYSQTLSHAQASYRVLIKDATDTTPIYDSGTVASAALSAAVPGGTLLNGVTYKLHLTVLSVDGL